MDRTDTNGARGRIVFGVDDNAANLSYLRETLASAGYVFAGFSTGPDCLSALLLAVPKLILLDVQMPGMDGFETCRRLRALPETRTVPVAFLTAMKTREHVRAGLLAGGNDFFVKPFEREKLLERVQMWTTRQPGTAAPRD
jgi:CheY-like chemotaxis protein